MRDASSIRDRDGACGQSSLNPLVLHKLGYDLRALYKDVVEAPIPASFGPAFKALLGNRPVSLAHEEDRPRLPTASRLGRDSFQFRS